MFRRDQRSGLLKRGGRQVLALLSVGLIVGLILPDRLREFIEPTAYAINYTVTTTADNGDNNNPTPGSLRQAIINANNTTPPFSARITFSIGTGLQTITPPAALPIITFPTTIDGTTQPGYSGAPLIELSGANISSAVGLFCLAPITLKGLVINRFNTGIGINLSRSANGSVIVGNYIGTDATGSFARGNAGGIGIDSSNNIVGGTTPAERNLISGNNHGIFLSFGSQNIIQGNYIGTNAAGNGALGNGNGIFIGNSASNDTIGGTASGAGNIISGNSTGIYLSGGSVTNIMVQGNFIGTDASGTLDIGNGNGIELHASNMIIGGTAAGARNIISGNDVNGILIDGSGNIVQGNYIGTNAAGTAPLGNSAHGINISNGSSNTIGGMAAGAGNLIAFNGGVGVKVNSSCINNRVQDNAIFSNGGLGIDLAGGMEDSFEVTKNDSGDGDAGANNLQNFPLLTAAISSGSNTIIQGTLNSTPGQSFRIEFFSNSTCDPSGYGEGQTFLGATNVSQTDNQGNGSFSLTVPTALINSSFLTATATDVNGNTSEFSPCLSSSSLKIDSVTPPAGRAAGGQQIKLAGAFANLSSVMIGGASANWSYSNGTSEITVTTPPNAAGAVNIVLTPNSGSTYTRSNAFAYLPTTFTDDTLTAGVTTAKAQHIIELRQAVDALRAVAGLAGAPWTDSPLLPTSTVILAPHITELRTYLEDAATRLGYPTGGSYTDSPLGGGVVIKRVHIEELRQRIRTIAG